MDEVKQLISEGAQLFKDGKLDEAIAKLKAALGLDPSSVQAHSYLGACYAKAGDHLSSVEQFQAAVDIDPDSAAHTFNLGQAFETSGNKIRAQALYEKALALDGNYARAQQRLDALTGKPAAPPRPAAPPPAPTPPPAQTVSMPVGPPPAATQIGQPYSPPSAPPQYGGPAAYGAQPSYGPGPQPSGPATYGPDPSLGLGKKATPYFSYASAWQRWAAAFIDGLILLGVGLAIGVAMSAASPAAAPGAGSPEQTVGLMATIMDKLQSMDMLIGFLYFVTLNTLLGQTPGKMVMGTRILKTDGTKIGFGTAIGRYVIQQILAICTCGLIYLVIIFQSENRGVHDLIMGTVVAEG